jgi:hypothetical protein
MMKFIENLSAQGGFVTKYKKEIRVDDVGYVI